jgi:hypothetical protein
VFDPMTDPLWGYRLVFGMECTWQTGQRRHAQ